MVKTKLFMNDALQEEFDNMGYIIVDDFLSPEEVQELSDYYSRNPLPDGKGFHASSHSKDTQYKRDVHTRVTGIFNPKATSLIQGYRPLTSSYTIKEIGKDSFFDFHLDWNMVDENKHLSITIWCPLEDVNAENGNLWVLDESHKLGDTIRSGPGLYLFTFDNVDIDNSRFKKRALALKAGTAVIYNHKLFHGSPPNMSDKVRIAVNHVMIPEGTNSVHYTMLNEHEIAKYEVDDDFYNRFIIDSMPDSVKLLDTIEVKSPHLNQDQVNQMIIE